MNLPTPKMERWKYTNLSAKLKKLDLQKRDGDIAFNGTTDYLSYFSEENLDWVEKAINQEPPGADKYGDMMLWQAANDVEKQGFVLDVPPGNKDSKPLEVTCTGHDGAQTAARYIVRVGAGAEFTLVEYQVGSGKYWNNIVLQIELAKGASLKHYRFQENSDQSVVTQNTHVLMGEESSYDSFIMTTGAALSRNQIHVDIKGVRASCKISGVNMLDGAEIGDSTITVEHHAPNSYSIQNCRNVAKEKATAIFQGKAHVHQAAQKTDAAQMVKSLLLSQQATVNAKPELEIYADDVKCSHGATTGCLDENALFYLRSRGISEKSAKDLLIQAFVSEVLEDISNADIKEQASHIVSRWLQEEEASDQSWLEV